MSQPLPAGNAAQLVLRPPKGAATWRVQRNTTGVFTGPATPGAAVVADDWGEASFVDMVGLTNGTPHHYRVDYRDAAGAWMAGKEDVATVTPMATFGGDPVDPQILLRDRLEAGLAVEVQRGTLKASAKKKQIEVLMAPFALSDNIAFPIVSVHLESLSSAERMLGETIAADRELREGGWRESEGWLARCVLNIVGVALNPGERAALRRAINRVVLANLPVLDAAGIILPDLQQRDHEDSESYNAPLFFTLGTFSCLCPVFATGDVGEIESVEVEAFTKGELEQE